MVVAAQCRKRCGLTDCPKAWRVRSVITRAIALAVSGPPFVLAHAVGRVHPGCGSKREGRAMEIERTHPRGEAIRQFLRRGVVPEVSRAAGKIICISSVHEIIPWAGHALRGVEGWRLDVDEDHRPRGNRRHSLQCSPKGERISGKEARARS